jgi:hypothetical protein
MSELEAEILRKWKAHRETLIKRYPENADKFSAAEVIHLRKLALQVMAASNAREGKRPKPKSSIIKRGV